MDRNLQSHPKFIAKYVRDLKALYENKQYDTYINRFKEFKQVHTPDDTIVKYYFEALMHKKLYYYVTDYALKRLQAGEGEYEDNMSFLLRAMLEEGRYDEVLDFTAHLSKETIPHRFRMFIQEVRHAAEEKLHAQKDKQRTYIEDAREAPIEKDVFLKYNEEGKLAFIARITKQKNSVHREPMRKLLGEVNDNTLKTAMLIYLKSIEDSERLSVKKYDQEVTIVPGDLPQLEDTKLGGVVLREVMQELEGNAPDIMELAQSLIISIMMDIYPVEPPFDQERLVLGFLKYLLDSVNIPYNETSDNEVTAWIERHFET